MQKIQIYIKGKFHPLGNQHYLVGKNASVSLLNYTPLTCIQRMQYYPSGLPWKDCYHADKQPIKYNGKEFVEMHGLDEYDSQARWYYPAIMRTTTMDPLCEKYYSTSPYAWCNNNPVNYVDPDGRKIVVGSWWGRALAMLGVNNFEAKTQNRLQSLKTISKELNEAITNLESNSTVIIHIFPTSQFQKDYPIEAAQNDSWRKGVTNKNGSNSTIYYQVDKEFLVDGNHSSADAILAHAVVTLRFR